MVDRAFPVLYSMEFERAAQFWEALGFERHFHFHLPDEGEPRYVGLRSGSAEMAITHASWAADRYGMEMGNGPRVEMYLYVRALEATLDRLRAMAATVLLEPDDMSVCSRGAGTRVPLKTRRSGLRWRSG